MTPELWLRVKEIYHSASEVAVAERPAFLDTACGADADLRREVESLLAEDGSRAGLLATVETGEGSQLGPYRIEVSIGHGGMGEVWKARDTRLNRDVAIKIAAQQFSDRFEREARAIAALNHPNICTIHDVGPNYLVMELVEGPTLAERMKRGAIPLKDALAIAKQIADALEAAHEKGIVHRDLKPANIKIRPDGSVKVLDFGLAKAVGPGAGADAETQTMTTPGLIMGTPGYMSPEQAHGEMVDRRADIWAFGVVLYEMVTGQRLFEGKSVSDTLAAVITREPDWSRAPVQVRRLLQRCLEKDPRRRLRDIGEAMYLLDESETVTARHLHSRFGTAGWIGGGVFAVAAAALAVIHFREKPVESPVISFTISPPADSSFAGVRGSALAVSPDGKSIAFDTVAKDSTSRLWVRSLDSPVARQQPGAEGWYGTSPFWSPDGKSIGFVADGKLKRIDVAGGGATILTDVLKGPGPTGTWNGDGVILFSGNDGTIHRVAASGGTDNSLTKLDIKAGEPIRQEPWFLPDGRHFLYVSGKTATSGPTIGIGSLNSPAEDRQLGQATDGPVRFTQGHLLFYRGTTLMSRPFDAGNLAFTGDAVPVAERIRTYSVSSNGVLVYSGGSAEDMPLTWMDRNGKRLGTLGEPDQIGWMNFSPDWKHVAFLMINEGNWDIWTYDVQRGVRTRFTTDPAQEYASAWSPHGDVIVFNSRRKGNWDIYRKAADGSGAEELVYEDDLQKYPYSFSPNGRFLAYYAYGGIQKQGKTIWILPDPLGPVGASKPYRFLNSGFIETSPQFSPDGKWIAYQSNKSGPNDNQLYVAPFPGPGGSIRVSKEGATLPRWSRDGKELFYIGLGTGQGLMAARIDEKGASLEVGRIEPLFGGIFGQLGPSFDVAPDGRFLVIPESPKMLTVVQNWTARLKK